MTKLVAPVLILDSNVWVSERMLHSVLGAATLHALIKSGMQIGLPEIVELEVNQILLEQADKAVGELQRSAQFLRQIAGCPLTILAPSQAAVKRGLDDRWQKLSGILYRLPFVQEHARAALVRINDRAPPSGPNNEQFRDCCIWQCALALAADRTVHFVTGDLAFYEGRNREYGLANNLAAELKALNREVRLHPNLNSFLGSMGSDVRTVDEAAIHAAIVAAVMPRAQEMAGERAASFNLGSVCNLDITGYATPKASVIAVSFSLSFNLSRTLGQRSKERQVRARLGITGGCSYDPNTQVVSDIEVSEWSTSSDGDEGGFWSESTHSPDFAKQFSDGSYRII